MERVSAAPVLIGIACCLVCISADPQASNSRHVRQASKPVYYLDIYVLADYSAYQMWYDRTSAEKDSNTRSNDALYNMQKYYALVIKEVSEQYSRLETSFTLKFNLVSYYIIGPQFQGTVDWTQRNLNGMVNAPQALERLITWLRAQKFLPPFDHAILFTGENLDNNDNGLTAGRGTLGTLCKVPGNSSASVIEDAGAFQGVSVAVHELGHSLNAVHDGDDNSCSASDRYIMAAGSNDVTPENARNPWFFSRCSTTEIQNYVQGLVNSSDNQSLNCLTKKEFSSGVPNVTNSMPGQLYNADEQCQHLYGPQSSFYFLGNLSNVCLLLSCGDPTDNQREKYWQRVAASGTSCGSRQWCEVGECVASPKAPFVSACFRDSVRRVNGMKCGDLVANFPSQCYYSSVNTELCCQSCANIHSGIAGCPFGDRKVGCTKDFCQRILPTGEVLDHDCCGTCNFDNSTWVCADAARVDGLTCPEALRRNSMQGCYNATLAFLCCASCQQKRDLSKGKGCEYGNAFLGRCATPASGAECDDTLCCDSCRSTSGCKQTGPHTAAILMTALVTVLCLIRQHLLDQSGSDSLPLVF